MPQLRAWQVHKTAPCYPSACQVDECTIIEPRDWTTAVLTCMPSQYPWAAAVLEQPAHHLTLPSSRIAQLWYRPEHIEVALRPAGGWEARTCLCCGCPSGPFLSFSCSLLSPPFPPSDSLSIFLLNGPSCLIRPALLCRAGLAPSCALSAGPPPPPPSPTHPCQTEQQAGRAPCSRFGCPRMSSSCCAPAGQAWKQTEEPQLSGCQRATGALGTAPYTPASAMPTCCHHLSRTATGLVLRPSAPPCLPAGATGLQHRTGPPPPFSALTCCPPSSAQLRWW